MTERSGDRWTQCKARLAERLEPAEAEAWLPALRLVQVSPQRVVITGVPNAFFRKHILRRYAPQLRQALAEAYAADGLDAAFSLDLRVGRDDGRAASDPPPEDARTASREEPGPGQAPSAPLAGSLAAFHAGAANRVAWEAACSAAQRPGALYNPLVFTGDVGLGKTHLLLGIRDEVEARHPDWRVVYCTAETFTNDVLEGIRQRRMPTVRERYRSADVLLVDDAGFLEVSAKGQEELLHTLDALVRSGRQVVVSSARLPRALQRLSGALRTRLEGGLIAELSPPHHATRLSIARTLAARHRLQIAPEALELLAERITTTPRRLEGALVRLAAYGSMMAEALGPAFVEAHAAPFFDPEPTRAPQVPARAVLQAVCETYGVTRRKLCGRDSSRLLRTARRVAMLLLRDHAGLSYSEIGRVLGHRSHSTVIPALQSLERELAGLPELRRRVHELRETLNAGCGRR